MYRGVLSMPAKLPSNKKHDDPSRLRPVDDDKVDRWNFVGPGEKERDRERVNAPFAARRADCFN